MTNHRRVWLIFRAIICAGFLLYGRAVLAYSETNSLDWCVLRALEQRGVPVSLDMLRVWTGAAFGPEIATGALCFCRGQQIARARLMAHAGQALGITWRPVDLTSGAWDNPLVQRSVRALVILNLRAKDSVLAEGAWMPSPQARQWGVVHDIADAHVTRGATLDGARALSSAIETMAVLRPTNASFAPTALRDATLATAVRILCGAPAHTDGGADVLTGMAAVNWIADAAHRTPWCPACARASATCIVQFLRTWRDDMRSGVTYLNQEANGLAGDRAQAVRAAATALEKAVGEVTILADEQFVRPYCADAARQAALGEQIRAVNTHLRAAALSLAQASGMTSLPTIPAPTRLVGLPVAASAAPWLPLFARMQDGTRPLLCSLLVATRFANVTYQREWIKAAYRNPFLFFLPVRPEADLPDVPDEIQACRSVCDMSGCPVMLYTLTASDPDRVFWFVRHAIAASLKQGMLVVAGGIGGSNVWSLIAGYKESGATLLCRTPVDQEKDYQVSTELPRLALVIRQAGIPSSDRTVLLRLVRAALSSNTTSSSFISGTAAFSLWRQRMRDCLADGIEPTPAFASWSGQIWARLVEQRREAYQLLELAGKAVPEAALDLLTLRNIYVVQLNALLAAEADGYTLRLTQGSIEPKNWLQTSARQQIETIDRIMLIETDAENQLRVVRDRMENHVADSVPQRIVQPVPRTQEPVQTPPPASVPSAPTDDMAMATEMVQTPGDRAAARARAKLMTALPEYTTTVSSSLAPASAAPLPTEAEQAVPITNDAQPTFRRHRAPAE